MFNCVSAGNQSKLTVCIPSAVILGEAKFQRMMQVSPGRGGYWMQSPEPQLLQQGLNH